VNALLQNRINISIIFNYLRDHGAAYRAQLARDLGISAPAVSRAIEKLLKDEYVTESERVVVENGKKAARVCVNAGRGYIVGVDLLADPVTLAISDFGGSLHDSWAAAPMEAGANFSEYLVREIHAGIGAFESRTARPPLNVLGIAIGVPAVVDPRSGAILGGSLYEHIARSDFRDRVSGHFRVPVFIENISNLAAIGEWKRGVGRGLRNLVFIEIGNGIGAGIILDGGLYRGAVGAAGEIGFSITESAGLDGGAGKRGFLESRASLVALGPGDSARAVFEAAASGDADAASLIGGALKHLAIATINLMLLLNPEMVILGGAVCELPGVEALILEPLKAEVSRNFPFRPATIGLASLGAKASIIGALQFALDSLVVHAYPYRLLDHHEPRLPQLPKRLPRAAQDGEELGLEPLVGLALGPAC
jgi:predicted NBD/HSP70 family sugar kinase